MSSIDSKNEQTQGYNKKVCLLVLSVAFCTIYTVDQTWKVLCLAPGQGSQSEVRDPRGGGEVFYSSSTPAGTAVSPLLTIFLPPSPLFSPLYNLTLVLVCYRALGQGVHKGYRGFPSLSVCAQSCVSVYACVRCASVRLCVRTGGGGGY